MPHEPATQNAPPPSTPSRVKARRSSLVVVQAHTANIGRARARTPNEVLSPPAVPLCQCHGIPRQRDSAVRGSAGKVSCVPRRRARCCLPFLWLPSPSPSSVHACLALPCLALPCLACPARCCPRARAAQERPRGGPVQLCRPDPRKGPPFLTFLFAFSSQPHQGDQACYPWCFFNYLYYYDYDARPAGGKQSMPSATSDSDPAMPPSAFVISTVFVPPLWSP
jgi:hypothetical protein